MRPSTFFIKSLPWGRRALALAAAAALSGCQWMYMNDRQSVMKVEGPVAQTQLDLFYVTCWVTLVIFIVVGSVLAYTIIKFRARSEADEHAEPPEQGHGNPFIEVGLIGASVLALAIIAFPTFKAIGFTYDVPEAEKAGALKVVATGYQWWFKFEYPGEQIAGAGNLTTGNELVIPAGRAVHIDLRSVDVMHSFWIPKLAGKVDMIPNRANLLWLKADHPGYYLGQCAEFCGESHAVMRFRVIALAPEDYAKWVTQQKLPAREVAVAAVAAPKAQFASLRTFKQNEIGFSADDPLESVEGWRANQFPDKDEDAALIAQGKALFQAKTCIVCHTIRGLPSAVGVRGPELTHVGARTTIAAGLLENNAEQLQRWIHNPSLVKPGNKMWVEGYLVNHITLSSDEEVALVAFLRSLK